MGRAFTCALGVLATTLLFVGALAPASASEAGITVVTKASPSQVLGGTPNLPPTPGVSWVTTSEKPAKFVDYTVSNLISLAAPWPIEEAVEQAQAPAPIAPTTAITKSKPKPKPKPIAQKPEQKLSWLTADWWRGLTSLRIPSSPDRFWHEADISMRPL
jgi:hypothetical protein